MVWSEFARVSRRATGCPYKIESVSGRGKSRCDRCPSSAGSVNGELIDNKFSLKSDISRRKLAEGLGVREGALMDALWSWNKQKREFAAFIQGRFHAKHNRPFPALVSADAALDPETKAFIRDAKLPDCASGGMIALRPFWPRWKCFAEGGG